MFWEVDYAEVVSIEQACDGGRQKKTFTISYHLQPDRGIGESLDEYLATLSPEAPQGVPAHLQEAAAWRLKATQDQLRREQLFYKQSNLLLSRTTSRIYELSQRLDRLAHHDELTGTLNRRAIFNRAQSLQALAMRHTWPLSFIMLDIDHFKRVNDTWGHGAGDETLRSISAALTARLRASDLFGRIGGEEFLVVLPQTDRDVAGTVAESLRASVQALSLATADNRLFSVTISLGVVSATVPRESTNTYIRQADQALYQAKREGRNRVAVFAPESDSGLVS